MQKLVFRNGKGVEVDLTKDPYGIIQWEGFSSTDVNIQSQQVPFNDGSVFLDALLDNRELSVTLSINDENDLEKRYELRRQLVSLMNPKLGEGVLIYTNDFTSKQIKVIPSLPAIQNKNANQSGTVKASLTWTACNPYWEDVDEKTVVFDITEQPVIENEGDVPTPVKVDLYSTKVINPSISNLTTEKKVGLNGTFTFAEIDTASGKKTIEGYHIYGEYLTSNLNFIKVIYADELQKFFAIGNEYNTNNAFILEGTDGQNWKIINYVEGIFSDISYNPNNNLLLAICNTKSTSISYQYDKGILRTSSDGGTNWNDTELQIHGNSSYNDMLVSIVGQRKGFSNKLIIFGRDEYFTSSDGGVNWTSYTNDGTKEKGVYVYNHNGVSLYVAYNSKIFTSEDAITWTERQDTVTYTISGVSRTIFINNIAFNYDGEGNFIDTVFAVGLYGVIFKSTDFINWTYTRNSNLNNLNDVLYHPLLSTFIVSGDKIYGETYYSPVLVCVDKEHWEIMQLLFPNTLNGSSIEIETKNICFSKTLNLLLIQCGGKQANFGCFAKSTDCYTWELFFNGLGTARNVVYDFAEGNGTLVAGSKNYILKKGETLKDWGIIKGNLQSTKQVTFGNGIFLAIYDSEVYDNTIRKSTDGETWEFVTLPYSAKYTVCRTEYRNNIFQFFWVMGQDENNNAVILRSSDTITWELVTTIPSSINGSTINDVVFENIGLNLGGYVVCDDRKVFRIRYAQLWIGSAGINGNIKGICYITRRRCFIAVGETDATNHRAVIYKSPLINGQYSYWQKVYESTENNTCLYSCAYSEEENLVLAVGQGLTLASVGGEDWEKVSFENNFIPFHSVFFSKKEHCFLLGGEGTLICKTKFNNKENLIEHITDDSDMSLNLEVGENVLRLNYDEGYILCKVTYREKYLGV